jgi:putative tryptophan/tyrosine transport system substrate-binding protein
MRRRAFIAALGSAVVWPRRSHAQQADRIRRVGILRPGPLADASLDAFRQGLREVGQVERRTILVEGRSAQGNVKRLPALARDLVDLKVDVIVAEHSAAIQAAKQESKTIPIVMAASADPVGAGLVASLARPGGNVTGFSRVGPETDGKRLELLKEILPAIKRVAFIWDPNNPGLLVRFKAAQTTAAALGLEVQSLEVRAASELQTALEAASADRAAALVVPSPMVSAYREQIVDFAAKHRLPLVYDAREFVEELGVLMSYGSNLPDLWRRAAALVDRILKGANPADLPVEQPTKFELVVNLKTAKALGLDIPPMLLGRADEVIE